MKLSAQALREMKSVSAISILTAYTCPVARCLEKAGIPAILVGDTVGMVEMGFDSTRHVTLEHMRYHVGAVRRGARQTHVIGDLPYNSYGDRATALESARRLIDAGADSVKLEGPTDDVIAHLVANGVDVVGHTGLTPQTCPDFKQAGRTESDAQRILDEATEIADAGAFMVVLEHIPADLAERITRSLTEPSSALLRGLFKKLRMERLSITFFA